MIIPGNFLFAIATLIYLALLASLYGQSPRGGDAMVGYAWSVVILNLVFAVCMVLITCILGVKGAFDWVATNRPVKLLLVIGGLLTSLIAIATTSLFKYEHGPGLGFIQWLAQFVPLLLPLLLLLSSFILLNNTTGLQLPEAVYKWTLMLALLVGITGTGAALQVFMADVKRNQKAVQQSRVSESYTNHSRMLNEIDSCDVTKDMVFILVFTDANQDKELRERAVAKVKSNPQWQQEIIARLKNDWSPEAFNFLASNDVDDPKLFAEAVNEGILIQAKLIRATVRNCSHPSHLYAHQFSWEVERALRTADRFSGTGADYRQAVTELRAALDESCPFEKPDFECRSLLDRWIKKHP